MKKNLILKGIKIVGVVLMMGGMQTVLHANSHNVKNLSIVKMELSKPDNNKVCQKLHLVIRNTGGDIPDATYNPILLNMLKDNNPIGGIGMTMLDPKKLLQKNGGEIKMVWNLALKRLSAGEDAQITAKLAGPNEPNLSYVNVIKNEILSCGKTKRTEKLKMIHKLNPNPIKLK